MEFCLWNGFGVRGLFDLQTAKDSNKDIENTINFSIITFKYEN
jgi:hypothetical protein